MLEHSMIPREDLYLAFYKGSIDEVEETFAKGDLFISSGNTVEVPIENDEANIEGILCEMYAVDSTIQGYSLIRESELFD
jgi:hypothetical protein